MSEPETNAAEDLAGLLFDYFASGHSEGCRVDWDAGLQLGLLVEVASEFP